MKYLSAIFASLVLACGHAHSPKDAAQHANESDCQNVYHYIVSLTVDQIDSDHSLSPKEKQGLEYELEQKWEESGSKDRFLASCQKSMTIQQVDCALHVKQVEDMHTCVTLIH